MSSRNYDEMDDPRSAFYHPPVNLATTIGRLPKKQGDWLKGHSAEFEKFSMTPDNWRLVIIHATNKRPRMWWNGQDINSMKSLQDTDYTYFDLNMKKFEALLTELAEVEYLARHPAPPEPYRPRRSQATVITVLPDILAAEGTNPPITVSSSYPNYDSASTCPVMPNFHRFQFETLTTFTPSTIPVTYSSNWNNAQVRPPTTSEECLFNALVYDDSCNHGIPSSTGARTTLNLSSFKCSILVSAHKTDHYLRYLDDYGTVASVTKQSVIRTGELNLFLRSIEIVPDANGESAYKSITLANDPLLNAVYVSNGVTGVAIEMTVEMRDCYHPNWGIRFVLFDSNGQVYTYTTNEPLFDIFCNGSYGAVIGNTSDKTPVDSLPFTVYLGYSHYGIDRAFFYSTACRDFSSLLGN